MLLNHFVREHSTRFISDQNLLWLETCKFLNAFIDIARNKILVATVHLCIGLLDQRYPDFIYRFASSENWLSSLNINWNSFIYEDVYPLEVYEDTNNIKPNRSELMENRWVNTLA
jgi:hypothetical protein